jgi:hypothetical protein
VLLPRALNLGVERVEPAVLGSLDFELDPPTAWTYLAPFARTIHG